MRSAPPTAAATGWKPKASQPGSPGSIPRSGREPGVRAVEWTHPGGVPDGRDLRGRLRSPRDRNRNAIHSGGIGRRALRAALPRPPVTGCHASGMGPGDVRVWERRPALRSPPVGRGVPAEPSARIAAGSSKSGPRFARERSKARESFVERDSSLARSSSPRKSHDFRYAALRASPQAGERAESGPRFARKRSEARESFVERDFVPRPAFVAPKVSRLSLRSRRAHRRGRASGRSSGLASRKNVAKLVRASSNVIRSSPGLRRPESLTTSATQPSARIAAGGWVESGLASRENVAKLVRASSNVIRPSPGLRRPESLTTFATQPLRASPQAGGRAEFGPRFARKRSEARESFVERDSSLARPSSPRKSHDFRYAAAARIAAGGLDSGSPSSGVAAGDVS